MSKEAFVFDMDGVMVDSERAWDEHESNFLDKTLGKEINSKVGNTVGISVRGVYERATELGFRMPMDEFQRLYDIVALSVYDRASITPDIESLGDYLLRNSFSLGLVSASPTSWINRVLSRISFGNKFKSIISLNERYDLKGKPAPDGYIESMRNLRSKPDTTIILEDSNPGIKSAKTSGAFTIALRVNLVPGYLQTEKADAYADTIKDVLQIVESLRL